MLQDPSKELNAKGRMIVTYFLRDKIEERLKIKETIENIPDILNVSSQALPSCVIKREHSRTLQY